MGNITLSFNSKKNKGKFSAKRPENKEKILLTYHDCIQEKPEYFSYIDSNGNEMYFNDSSYTINKISSTQYIARKSYVAKVPLEFIESKAPVQYQKAYFTYNGNERYLDKVNYNSYTNSYVGTLEVVNVYDKEVLLYEE